MAFDTSAAHAGGAEANSRSAMVLLLALAVHSMIEMMAFGLAGTKQSALLLAGAISIHQPAESLALLVALLKGGLPTERIAVLLSLFSAVGYVGAALGTLIGEFAGPVVEASLIAVTAGTFVYVGATEIIGEEFETAERKWPKFAALLSGVGAIALVTGAAEGLEVAAGV